MDALMGLIVFGGAIIWLAFTRRAHNGPRMRISYRNIAAREQMRQEYESRASQD